MSTRSVKEVVVQFRICGFRCSSPLVRQWLIPSRASIKKKRPRDTNQLAYQIVQDCGVEARIRSWGEGVGLERHARERRISDTTMSTLCDVTRHRARLFNLFRILLHSQNLSASVDHPGAFGTCCRKSAAPCVLTLTPSESARIVDVTAGSV